MLTSSRKFFGQPNGTKAPAKQSKLSFSTKATGKSEGLSLSSTKENDDSEIKEDESEVELNPRLPKVEETEVPENKEREKSNVLYSAIYGSY